MDLRCVHQLQGRRHSQELRLPPLLRPLQRRRQHLLRRGESAQGHAAGGAIARHRGLADRHRCLLRDLHRVFVVPLRAREDRRVP